MASLQGQTSSKKSTSYPPDSRCRFAAEGGRHGCRCDQCDPQGWLKFVPQTSSKKIDRTSIFLPILKEAEDSRVIIRREKK
jgi:hypothetical protein